MTASRASQTLSSNNKTMAGNCKAIDQGNALRNFSFTGSPSTSEWPKSIAAYRQAHW